MCWNETIGSRQGRRGPGSDVTMRAKLVGLLVVGLAALSPCLSQAAFAQQSGGILRMFHSDNPPSTSIHEEFSAATVVPFMPVFNNLVVFDPAVPQNSDKSVVPDLAESWSWNEDKTELTFKLRRGVKWHDGWAFTAADVECTFNLLTGRGARQAAQQPARQLVSQHQLRPRRQRLRSHHPPQPSAAPRC